MATEYYHVSAVPPDWEDAMCPPFFRVTEPRERYALDLYLQEVRDTVCSEATLLRRSVKYVRRMQPNVQERVSLPRRRWVAVNHGYWMRVKPTPKSGFTYAPFFPELPAKLCVPETGDVPYALPGRLLAEMMSRELPLAPMYYAAQRVFSRVFTPITRRKERSMIAHKYVDASDNLAQYYADQLERQEVTIDFYVEHMVDAPLFRWLEGHVVFGLDPWRYHADLPVDPVEAKEARWRIFVQKRDMPKV